LQSGLQLGRGRQVKDGSLSRIRLTHKMSEESKQLRIPGCVLKDEIALRGQPRHLEFLGRSPILRLRGELDRVRGLRKTVLPTLQQTAVKRGMEDAVRALKHRKRLVVAFRQVVALEVPAEEC